ncbi:MAG: extracellular solute-binding protein [Anaerolineae bacterium]|jgi:multiple sugar transport system substrate-binding protein
MKRLDRRSFLRAAALGGAGILAAACQPEVVEKIVKETVMVEGEAQVIEKVVKETVVVEVEKEVAAQPAPQGPVSVVFARFFGECADEYEGITEISQGRGECGIIQVITNAWNAEHPDQHVETMVVGWGEHYQRLAAGLAAGETADIAIMHGAFLPNYAGRGLLFPLDDMVTNTSIDVNDYLPTALDFGSYQNKLYGTPFDIHTDLWHINANLWEEAGLVDDDGMPIQPNGMDEFLAAAKAMKDTTGKEFFTDYYGDIGFRVLFALVRQQGGDVFSPDLETVTFETPEVEAALSFFEELFGAGYATRDIEDCRKYLLDGEVGSFLNGTWHVDAIDQQLDAGEAAFDRYVVYPHPLIFDQKASWANSHMWVLPVQNNPDPAKLDASMAFLEWLYQNNLEWARSGHLPVRRSAVDSPEFMAMKHRAEYAEAADIAVTTPRVPEAEALEQVMRDEFGAVILGMTSIEEGMANAQRRLEDFVLMSR